MRWMHGSMARLRLLRGRAAEERMEEEMRFHLEMETEKYLREGLSPEEARRRAALAFGGVEGHKEEMRATRTLGWLGGLSLDFRLGVRMLRKYPGLALVAVLGMAVAIAIGAGSFQLIAVVLDSDLPLEEGDRVVAIQQRPVAGGNPERRILHDFLAWREEAETVRELGAFRWVSHNLVAPGGEIEPVRVAAMTASGFRLARVPPLLGRYLLDGDEREGAPPVVVLGYRAWRARFAGDPAVVGREIRLDDTPHTVVGVMPEGFGFPLNEQYWTPLRASAATGPRQGPVVHLFGRLAPGVTMEQARAELEALARRADTASPGTLEPLRPQVLPYTHPWFELDAPSTRWLLYLGQLLVSLLLVVVAVNVAILAYARTATRTGEIVVRSALGASRGRIVTQFVVEALVLSAVATALGLLVVQLGLARLSALEHRLPFWLDFRLSVGTFLYAAGLAFLGALIVGVAPAMKATGRRMQSSLARLGGGTPMQMGRTWTTLIVAQVAVAVAVLPVAIALAWGNELVRGDFAMDQPGLPAGEVLTARLVVDPGALSGAAAAGSRLADRQVELLRRLEAEPGVSAVTFASRLPGMEFTGVAEVAAEGPGASAAPSELRFLQVDTDFFEVFGAEILAGRSFQPGDLTGAATAVVANRSFVERVLGGGSGLGRQLRYARTEDHLEPGGVEQCDWYEIVGVVRDFAGEEEGAPMLYHPARPGELDALSLIVRVTGTTPEAFAGRLRQMTLALDPALQIDEVLSVEQLRRQGAQLRRWTALAILVTTLSVLLLSAAGIHALTSLAVTRRRREIGIRAALGAQPRFILRNVFAGVLGQIGAGVAIGLVLGGLLDRLTSGALTGGVGARLPLATAAIMTAVGLVAALGPARRGLRIQPMEALRGE